eukprot:827846_1
MATLEKASHLIRDAMVTKTGKTATSVLVLLIASKERLKAPNETAVYKTRVHLHDIDWWLHMNNAAYLRSAELARLEWFLRTNVWNTFRQLGYDAFVMTAQNIRYRRQLRLFTEYEIQIRAVYWTEFELFFEERFVDCKTGFVNAILYNKNVLIKNGKRAKPSPSGKGMNNKKGLHVTDWYSETDDTFDNLYECRNQLAPSVKLWINSLEKSSNECRQQLQIKNKSKKEAQSHKAKLYFAILVAVGIALHLSKKYKNTRQSPFKSI